LTLTRGRVVIGFLIIIAGIALIAVGSALVTQTPEPLTGATDTLGGLAQWAQNVGVAFAKGLGIGLFYLGFGVIAGGVALLLIWYFH